MYFRKFEKTLQGGLASQPQKTRGWELYFGTRAVKWERRDGGRGTMGRFGGGWEVNIGVEAASWRDLFTLRSCIFNLVVGMLRFSTQWERSNESLARAQDAEKVPT